MEGLSSDLTFRQFVERVYIPYLYSERSPETAATYRRIATGALMSALGARRLRDVMPEEALAAADTAVTWDARRKSATVVRAVFDLAADMGLDVARVPVPPKAPLSDDGSGRLLFLPTFPQINSLLDMIPASVRDAPAGRSAVLGYGCGISGVDMRALRAQDIDLVRGLVSLPSGPVVPVLPEMAARMAAFGGTGDAYVVSKANGGPMTASLQSDALRRLSATLGVPRVTLPVMRQSFACSLVAEGLSPKEASRFLGCNEREVQTLVQVGVADARRRALSGATGAE